jgi:hypothetical protein
MTQNPFDGKDEYFGRLKKLIRKKFQPIVSVHIDSGRNESRWRVFLPLSNDTHIEGLDAE